MNARFDEHTWTPFLAMLLIGWGGITLGRKWGAR